MSYYSDLDLEGPYRTFGEADEARQRYPEEYRMATEPNPYPYPEPDDLDIGNDPAPGRCPTCKDSGQLCWDCGAIDQTAIGRKIQYLMKNDRPTLLRILSGTPRRQWYLLAKSYVTALGVEDNTQMVPTLGVVSLWGMLVKEAA